MKIIISPAKKMNVDTDTLAYQGLPVFLEQTKELMNHIQGLSYEQCKQLWNCNDSIAKKNFRPQKNLFLSKNYNYVNSKCKKKEIKHEFT